MGIGIDALFDLLDLKRSGELQGCRSMVEIGAQQLAPDFLTAETALAEVFAEFGRTVPSALAVGSRGPSMFDKQDHILRGQPLARDLWKALGFDYAAIDIDGSLDSVPLDLNYDSVPPEHARRYDLVTNFGTSEHVCNQLNCFKVIHDLAKPGGLMLHNLPAQGMMNHGLVNYNPKFFWMLARSNGYRMMLMTVRPGGAPYPLPDNIRNHLPAADLASDAVQNYRTDDMGIKIIFRKLYDFDYVAPIDVPTGSETDHSMLRTRYWTVFQHDSFAELLRHSHVEGSVAYANGDYPDALAKWTPLAERGDAGAQAGLGMLFINGQGVAQDEKHAAGWFCAAAERGNRDAQMVVSRLHATGRGVPQDAAAALRWLRSAATASHRGAQTELGMRYFAGDGLAVDHAEAAKWFTLAAESGAGEAQVMLGALYAGDGVMAPDLVLAHMWASLALAGPLSAEERVAALNLRSRLELEMQPEQLGRAATLAASRLGRAA